MVDVNRKTFGNRHNEIRKSTPLQEGPGEKTMRKNVHYRVIIMIIVPVLILVLMRTFGPNHFKPDASRWAEPSFAHNNIISYSELEKLSGDKLIINLATGKENPSLASYKMNSFSPDSMLLKEHLTAIKKHNGPVILYSENNALSARMWMIISQMGCRNIYILSDDKELFKNKFRPDTTARPYLQVMN